MMTYSTDESISQILELEFPLTKLRNTSNKTKNNQIRFHKETIEKKKSKRHGELTKLKPIELKNLLFRLKTIKTQDEMESLDAIRFYNQKEANADYIFWAKVPYWTIEEGIALLLGKNPHVVNWKSICRYQCASPFVRKYSNIRLIALRAYQVDILEEKITPRQLLNWAKHYGIEFSLNLEKEVNKFHSTTNSGVSSTEDNNSLKMLGGLAMVLVQSQKGKKFSKNDKPNKSAIYNEIEEILNNHELPTTGLKSSSFSKKLSQGLKLLLEE